MRVLLIGPGAIGQYIGAVLMGVGNTVVFAARGTTADRLRTRGIRLTGPRGTVQLPRVEILTDPRSSEGRFDIALSCVKLYDAESSAREWRTALKECDVVISLQNGIDGADRIRRGAQLENVYGGLAFIAASIDDDGGVLYQSEMSSVVVGGAGALHDARLQGLSEQLSAAGNTLALAGTVVDDIRSAQWSKHLGLATNAALTCLVRKPAGVLYHSDDLLMLARHSIAEAAAVGRAEGANFPDSQEEVTLQLLQSFPAGMYASMYHDLAAGRRLEVDGLLGPIVRGGWKHGVPTTFHSFALTCLMPFADGITRHGT